MQYNIKIKAARPYKPEFLLQNKIFVVYKFCYYTRTVAQRATVARSKTPGTALRQPRSRLGSGRRRPGTEFRVRAAAARDARQLTVQPALGLSACSTTSVNDGHGYTALRPRGTQAGPGRGPGPCNSQTGTGGNRLSLTSAKSPWYCVTPGLVTVTPAGTVPVTTTATAQVLALAQARV